MKSRVSRQKWPESSPELRHEHCLGISLLPYFLSPLQRDRRQCSCDTPLYRDTLQEATWSAPPPSRAGKVAATGLFPEGAAGFSCDTPPNTILTQIMADEFNFLWSKIENYHRGQNYYKKPLYKNIFFRGNSFCNYYKTLCIQLEKTGKRPQTYYKNNCFRQLFCNNFGQDGTLQRQMQI